MNLRTSILCIASSVLSLNAISQVSAKHIDQTLSESYRRLQNAEFKERFAPAFKNKFIEYLSSPAMFNNNLDSLETLIMIRQSPDRRIRFYSWDELTGGTWHEINSFVQYKGAGNKIMYTQLDTDKEAESGGFTDCEIYSVDEIKDGKQVYYLAFGWGSHGGGNQHQVIYLFKIEGNKLVKCKAFNQGETELILQYPRSGKLDLQFDKEKRSISFDEFKIREGELFAEKTGIRKSLQFSGGIFQ